MIPCLFHSMTGLECPGCGTQRALEALIRGNVAEAFRLNPYLCILVPLLALVFAFKRNWLHNSAFAIAVVVSAIAFGIVRNMPFYPF